MKTYFLIAALAVLTACSTMEKPADDSMAMEQQAAAGIAATNAKFEAAFDAGDAAGVAALYTEGAVLLPPGAPNASGRGAAQKLWQGYVDAKASDLKLMQSALDVHGRTATELGRYSVSVPDGKGGRMTVGGNYIVLWKRGEDGVWRLMWDIWNDDPAKM